MGKLVLTPKAKYVNGVLDDYKKNCISQNEASKLASALQKYFASLITAAARERDYFEILVNRYIIKEPLSLEELADAYGSNKCNIKSWEINKGILALSAFY